MGSSFNNVLKNIQNSKHGGNTGPMRSWSRNSSIVWTLRDQKFILRPGEILRKFSSPKPHLTPIQRWTIFRRISNLKASGSLGTITFEGQRRLKFWPTLTYSLGRDLKNLPESMLQIQLFSKRSWKSWESVKTWPPFRYAVWKSVKV